MINGPSEADFQGKAGAVFCFLDQLGEFGLHFRECMYHIKGTPVIDKAKLELDRLGGAGALTEGEHPVQLVQAQPLGNLEY